MKKGKKILAALMRMEGAPALKLSLFEKLKTIGMLDGEDPAVVKATEEKLRTLLAVAKWNG